MQYSNLSCELIRNFRKKLSTSIHIFQCKCLCRCEEQCGYYLFVLFSVENRNYFFFTHLASSLLSLRHSRIVFNLHMNQLYLECVYKSVNFHHSTVLFCRNLPVYTRFSKLLNENENNIFGHSFIVLRSNLLQSN